ncbi:MAG: HPr family phosphocarrier protein [Lachnospiraceae bacterium]|nr:HPr family phosphocarrier protein [Lachnospiraceae bacterium]
MTQRKIKLRPDEVKDFVAAASKCDFDIDIAYNRYVVDAKSFLGVMGLDFASVLTVSYAGYNAAFENMLGHYAMAC